MSNNVRDAVAVQTLTFVGVEINYLDQLIGELPTKYGKNFLELITAVQNKRRQEQAEYEASLKVESEARAAEKEKAKKTRKPRGPNKPKEIKPAVLGPAGYES